MADEPRIILPGDNGFDLVDSLSRDNTVMIATDLEGMFFENLEEAARALTVNLSEFAMRYVAGVMAAAARSENAYRDAPEGAQWKTLAMIYDDAVRASGRQERNSVLKNLGDTALFRAGLFSDFSARPKRQRDLSIEFEYCIGMGQAAYSFLSDNIDEDAMYGQDQGLFYELAGSFQTAVDMMARATKGTRGAALPDVFRLLSAVNKTNSKYAANALREQGIEPGMLPGFKFQ
ncbi:MAG: hypothetical protein H6867_03395 [Rhodospirillales bacterium]|nr:hypothetical protein [Rhodospirillales bacterium]MCB9996197.1 hypothetical protein [Rhodospirillales bacterium]